MEKRGILGDVSGRRPGDVTIPIWRAGKGLAIDVAVTSPFTAMNVGLAEPCEAYAVKKHAKYDADFKGTGHDFAAVVFETTGAVNTEGSQVLLQLFRFAARNTGAPAAAYTGRAWGRLSSVQPRSTNLIPGSGRSV